MPSKMVQVLKLVDIIPVTLLVYYDIQQTSDGEWRVKSMSGYNPSGYTVKCIHATCPQCSPLKDDIKVCNVVSCAHTVL